MEEFAKNMHFRTGGAPTIEGPAVPKPGDGGSVSFPARLTMTVGPILSSCLPGSLPVGLYYSRLEATTIYYSY
jgi:hypothetical protein